MPRLPLLMMATLIGMPSIAQVVSLTLAACSGSSDAASGSGSASGSAAAQDGTLKLWHYESANGAMGIAWDKAIEIFKQEHPGVTVDFERKAFEQIQQNAGAMCRRRPLRVTS